MASYITLTSARTTVPDAVALVANVKAATDATATLIRLPDGSYRGKKATDWTPADIAAAQSAIDTTPALTAQLEAQRLIDAMPLWEKAAFLLILDRFNLVGARLSPPVANVTPAQFLQAIRDKAGTL